MIFTPYTQEYYVKNAFNEIDNKFNQNFNLSKEKSFISNRYNSYFYSITKVIKNAVEDWKTNLSDIDLLIRRISLKNTYSNYLSLTPGWILPILKSESHKDILLNLSFEKQEPDFPTFHYILNKLISKKVVIADTDTFHQITKSYKFVTNNLIEIYGVKMKGTSFIRKLVKDSDKYEWQHNEYIPVVGYKYLFMTYIKNKFRKVWFNEIDNYFCNEELNNELSPIIKEYIKKDIYISIDKSILTVYSNKIAREEIIEIFEKIISIVNAYN